MKKRGWKIRDGEFNTGKEGTWWATQRISDGRQFYSTRLTCNSIKYPVYKKVDSENVAIAHLDFNGCIYISTTNFQCPQDKDGRLWNGGDWQINAVSMYNTFIKLSGSIKMTNLFRIDFFSDRIFHQIRHSTLSRLSSRDIIVYCIT